MEQEKSATGIVLLLDIKLYQSSIASSITAVQVCKVASLVESGDTLEDDKSSKISILVLLPEPLKYGGFFLTTFKALPTFQGLIGIHPEQILVNWSD